MDFLKEEGYIPSTQIGIFDKKQIIALAISFCASIILLTVMSFMGRSVNLLIFRVCVTFNLAVVVLRISNYIFVQKNFRADYALPFHLCSYNVFLSVIAAWTLNPYLLDFIFAMSPFAALSALLFPESLAGRYPHLNFRSIEYYTSHTLLIISPLFPVLFLGFTPNIKYFPFFGIIFCVLLLMAGTANYMTKGNYMFLSHAPSKTPLKMIEAKSGILLYRIVLIAIFLFLYFLMHGIYALFA